MRETKLSRLLKTLTVAEFKRFGKLVQSPFFNTNPSVVKLYTILKSYHPNYDTPKLEKERVYKKLFPSKKFNYHHYGNLLSELTRLAEEYLLQLELEGNELAKKQQLLQAYGKRNIHDLFEKEAFKQIEKLEQQPHRDADYFREMLALKRTYFFHPHSQRYSAKVNYPKEIMDLLDQYFALSKLQMTALLKNRQKVLSTTYDIHLLESVLEFSESEAVAAYPLFSIYQKLISFLDNPENTDTFFALKNNFETHVGQLKKGEQQEVLQYLINYCIRKINEGLFEYNQEVFGLYKLGLAHELVLHNNEINSMVYINIADVAGVLSEFEWAENFLKEYQVYLKKENRNEFIAFGLARLRFRQKDFDAVIDIINREDFQSTVYEASIRFLTNKAWFEKFLLDNDLYEFILSQIQTNEKFFYRDNHLNSKASVGFLNYFRIVKQIVKAKRSFKVDKQFKERLLQKVQEMQPLIGKVWLSDKINNL